MAISESQKRATKNYRAKTKRLTIDFYPQESDLLEWLSQQPSKMGYVKSLIRSDMERARKVDGQNDT